MRTQDASYTAGSLEKTDIRGSTTLSPTLLSVDNAPSAKRPLADTLNGTSPGARTRRFGGGTPVTAPSIGEAAIRRSKLPAEPADIRVRDLQTKLFTRPRLRLARNLVIGAGASSKVTSAYNRLRTQIVRRVEENGWNTIAITSPSRRSGNTLTAINLAISIARDFNYTVLLVELDLINPSFRKVLRLRQRQGLVDHLLHGAPIQEILLKPWIDRFIVIQAGSPVPNSWELLSSAAMVRFVDELKRRYERPLIVFDLPSVLAVDDAMAFAPLVDCALLVVEEGETRIDGVRRALDHLRSTKILGVVMNRSIHVENDGNMVFR